MKIRVMSEAHLDLAKGTLFYDTQSQGLGTKFLNAMESAIESLLKFAGMHARDNGYHRMLVRKFPFVVYYRMVDDVIEVVAVIDCRRDPEWIARRLDR